MVLNSYYPREDLAGIVPQKRSKEGGERKEKMKRNDSHAFGKTAALRGR